MAGFFAPVGAGEIADSGMTIHHSGATGVAAFVTAPVGKTIAVKPRAGRSAAQPIDFFHEHGHLFGVKDANRELTEVGEFTGSLGQIHTTYRQVHRGIPVFSGTLKLHQNADGGFIAANGDFYPIPDRLNPVPALPPQTAAAAAKAKIAAGNLEVEHDELVIVDPGWYGDPFIGAHLAYYVILTDPRNELREAFFIDAHDGQVLDRWTLIAAGKSREVYAGQNQPALPGILFRAEGWPPTANAEVNAAYDYAGDYYDFFYRMFNRDAIDNYGFTMVLTAHWGLLDDPACPDPDRICCPMAFWNGEQAAFCSGMTSDDAVGHELGHGLTQAAVNLIYQNQPGMLNESYSDIWGEMIDLFNGNVSEPGDPAGPTWSTPATYVGPGTDTPNNRRTPGTCSNPPDYLDGVRWMIGEDFTTDTPWRDVWAPLCSVSNFISGDPCCPDYANHPYQTCPVDDNDGVHQGSSIPSHAFAMLTDGKSFRGYEVEAIGAIKAAAVWYRALTVYLVPAADFEIAYLALNRAADDLIGTTPNDPRTGLPSGSEFTEFDAEQVKKALQAVEMNTRGLCGSSADVLSRVPPDECSPRQNLFSDDFENGPGAWTVESSQPGTIFEWTQRDNLPADRAGTAWFVSDPPSCEPTDPVALYSLISPEIVIPEGINELNKPILAFKHFVGTSAGEDGGNIKISVNGGDWQMIPGEAFDYNWYNSLIGPSRYVNPLQGQAGWTGIGKAWGTSVVDLGYFVSGGASIRIRFDFGKDCGGYDGWYVDDFRVYFCACDGALFCDDDTFCTGTESCVDGLCRPGDDPCAGGYCDEGNELCVATFFWDDFDNGNIRGWELGSADDTASQGQWEIGDPVGTYTSSAGPSQPEDPFAGPGCAFTGQNAGGSFGIGDVDGGVTYLVSPTIDLSGRSNAELRFARWFFQREFDGDDDFYKAEASDDNGSTWVLLEMIGPDQRANQWTKVSFQLEDFIDLTSTVKLRFAGQDDAASSDAVEVAIDELIITADDLCLPLDGDADGNCAVDLLDHARLIDCLTGPESGPYPLECTPFNFDADEDIDLTDMAEFQTAFGGM
ncbi:MAG: M4 family metallopeptidase [Phycisphaerales bacterium]|nr:MAG: M4 family metallopeptidase [Phycisphaerales bacterium]